MNILGAAIFLPSAHTLRALAGFPEDGHPLYLATVSTFVLIFGAGYLAAAMMGRADRLFVAVAAAGKLLFFALLVWFSATGTLPVRAALAGTGDLIFGILFLTWLYDVRGLAQIKQRT
jgi:hypothetical protein